VIIFTDSNDGIYGIEQEEDVFYNLNQDILHDKETITEITCQERVVTGLVQLKDYNYRFPGKQLQAESQIDGEAPGKYCEYGDHFKDEKEGDFLARIRNEEILSTRKIFSGRSDCRLFRAGFRFKMGKHYREEWNEQEYILTRLYLRGDQSGLFPYLLQGNQIVPTYENSFVAIPADVAFRPPRVTPVPKLYGVLTARLESGAGDEYAFMDDQGRYKMKVPFDLSDKTDGNASRVIRMSQPYSGPGYGIHFPNHADTEIAWTCINGDLDRPLGLGTIPNPSNSSPSTSANKSQSVIRTAGQNELTFDDKTGSENILLHGTKDWTIDIVNDKNQTIGNNETASVGNDRTRDVGNNETISIGSNRDKTVGANQSETIGANKTISVTGNHTETIAGNMSQTVSGNKIETVAIAKTTSIGAVFQISVGAAMNETVGAVKAEEIGATKSVNVGVNSSEDVGSNKSVNAGGNISESAGKDVAIQAGKKMVLASGDDFAISGGKKGVIDIKDQLTLKCGKAEITLKKNGDILINGKKINIKGSGDIVMKGKKVLQN
jgi:type VI secretion system secreted protein VgrG